MKWFFVALFMFGSYSSLSEEVRSDHKQQTARWEWTSTKGEKQSITLNLSESDVQRALKDKQRLDYSLAFPLEALQGYLHPLLQQVIDQINQLREDPEPYFTSLSHALGNEDNTPESALFWQAFNQYQRDAFRHLRILPCEDPQKTRSPCIRPNYSQLFYAHKASMQKVARQFVKSKALTRHEHIQHMSDWINSIPQREEQHNQFFPPMLGLTQNALDSDERALTLAGLISEVAPTANLKLIYPIRSLGSASPTWLAIPASLGVAGEKVVIDDEIYILLSGPKSTLQSLIQDNIELISISLY